jgi:hypothetical protein
MGHRPSVLRRDQGARRPQDATDGRAPQRQPQILDEDDTFLLSVLEDELRAIEQQLVRFDELRADPENGPYVDQDYAARTGRRKVDLEEKIRALKYV